MAETRFYGGQAVIEGVMMRGRDVYATAVRRRDGRVVVDRRPVPHFLEGWRLARLPFVRGTFALIETLTLGLRSLQFSANVALQDEAEAEAARAPEEQTSAPPRVGPRWTEALIVAAAGALCYRFLAPRLAPLVAGFMAGGREPDQALQAARVLIVAAFGLLVLLALAWPRPKAAPAQQLDDSALWMAMLPAFAVGIGLFVLLPSSLAGLLKTSPGYGGAILKNFLEGIIRLAVILGYIAAIGQLAQVRRVFQYHGAEHKVINSLELSGEVSEESALKHSPLHPRCGTAFLLMFIALKIIIGCFFGWPVWYIRFAIRLLMIPIVAALAYEATRVAGKYRHSPFVRALSAPGLLLQRLTTREPESGMVQVAMYALAAVAPEVTLPGSWAPPTESRTEMPEEAAR